MTKTNTSPNQTILTMSQTSKTMTKTSTMVVQPKMRAKTSLEHTQYQGVGARKVFLFIMSKIKHNPKKTGLETKVAEKPE